MNIRRNTIIIIFLIFSFFVFLNWQKYDQSLSQKAGITNVSQLENQSNTANPNILVNIRTNTLYLQINKYGNIVKSYLLNYKDLHSSNIFTLFSNTDGNYYIAQTGLTGPNGTSYVKDNKTFLPTYTVEKPNYVATKQGTAIDIPLVYKVNGITYIKTYIVSADSYAVKVKFTVINNTAKNITVTPYAQLDHKDLKSTSYFSQSYAGAAYSTNTTAFTKYSLGKIKKNNLYVDSKGGWIAMLQHYFTAALIPASSAHSIFYTKYLANDNLTVLGYQTAPINIAPQHSKDVTMQMWIGPNLPSQMSVISPTLHLTVNYGYLWFISKPLFIILKLIQSAVVNWGLAMIILTLFVRMLMYPLTKAQYTSMARMRMLQPRIQELKERYGKDRQIIAQKTSEIYREEKVSPLGGCFPVLLQMPIFLGLYWMFLATAQLRAASFLWVPNLAAPDPYYILPILMGVSMFFLQRMSPMTSTDPMQQKIMMWTPVIFTLFFLNFSSGLVIYWVTSNAVSILQQAIIYRNLEKKGLHVRRSKKTTKK